MTDGGGGAALPNSSAAAPDQRDNLSTRIGPFRDLQPEKLAGLG